MTDTTAPLAVTMDLVERVDGLALWLAANSNAGDLAAADLRALTSIARRCLEPDGETVARMWRAYWGCGGSPDKLDVENLRAAIAALVNPDGK